MSRAELRRLLRGEHPNLFASLVGAAIASATTDAQLLSEPGEEES